MRMVKIVWLCGWCGGRSTDFLYKGQTVEFDVKFEICLNTMQFETIAFPK